VPCRAVLCCAVLCCAHSPSKRRRASAVQLPPVGVTAWLHCRLPASHHIAMLRSVSQWLRSVAEPLAHVSLGRISMDLQRISDVEYTSARFTQSASMPRPLTPLVGVARTHAWLNAAQRPARPFRPADRLGR
jgi:hypothetical protein